MKLCKGFARGRVRAYILQALNSFVTVKPLSRAGSLPQWIAVQVCERACSRKRSDIHHSNIWITPCPTSSWSKTTPRSPN
ncbi:hypothetical protein [Pseudomonas fluorescens]|nr:hypothetical protein [Pseudomonas fluorescens]